MALFQIALFYGSNRMWKHLCRVTLISIPLFIPLLLLLSPAVWGQPQSNDRQFLLSNLQDSFLSPRLLLQQAAIDEPFCFMQTADGRVIDLQRLCGSSTNGQPGSSSSQTGLTVSRFRRNCSVMQCATRSQLRPIPLSSR